MEECEKKLKNRKCETFSMILLDAVNENPTELWRVLERLLIGKYTKAIDVIDIPPPILLEIIKNAYLKTMFYYSR